MRTSFLNIAYMPTIFDIGALPDVRLKAKFNEERIIRYVTILLTLFPPVL